MKAAKLQNQRVLQENKKTFVALFFIAKKRKERRRTVPGRSSTKAVMTRKRGNIILVFGLFLLDVQGK